MFTLNEIRNKYLKFFESKGSLIEKSSGLVPDDPTLMFTNSGMVQFKNYFKGLEIPKHTRITTSQKCVRAGGKHNDLDNVGYTARHHTFFEMLGNFSFNAYFKKEAITWAWEFLTKVLMLPEEKLLATIYYNDEEAFDIWHNKVGLPVDRIIRISTKDNFWEMGDTGPCGPCSEIFYDHGPDIFGGKPGSPEEDGDRYIEIWNIVFTQFNRKADGSLEELPMKCIDTGMGLERISAVLQGVHNNFEIDLFKHIIDNSKNIIGDGDIFSHRIIADHLRSSAFLICDGVLPSNEGRGYVLRRIMRRAMLQIHKLNCKKVSMYRLIPSLIEKMGDVYPELIENENLIMETLKTEEEKFRITLDRGIKLLNEEIEKYYIENNKALFSGYVAFELYDTYGFPLDLTQMILNDKDIEINTEEFEKAMQEQKDRSKVSWVGSGDVKQNELYLKLNEKTEFLGYKEYVATGKILKLIKNNSFVETVSAGDEVEIITDKTVFYGESGGQIGDSGLVMLIGANGVVPLPFSIIEIENTIKTTNGVFIHIGKVAMGSFKINDCVNLTINKERRRKIAANHSSAHLLQYGLRKMFGETIVQKGSSVDENRMRFDFSYNKPLTDLEIIDLEKIVNELIIKNTEVKIEYMNVLQAKDAGAMALFGEKYGDEVRVVSMGECQFVNNSEIINENNNTLENVFDALSKMNSKSKTKEHYSMELCGGTHIKRTGDIGLFKILKEESIASGIRRIEACTGIEAINYINSKLNILNTISDSLKVSSSEILIKLENLIKENKDFKKQIEGIERDKLNKLEFIEEKYKNITFIHKILEDTNPNEVKTGLLNWLNTKFKEDFIIILICKNKDKNTILVGVSKNICAEHNANEILKFIGAKGGGQPYLATGSIDDFTKNDIQKIKEKL